MRLATPGATVLKAANPQAGKQQIIVQKPGGAPGSQQIVTLVMTSQEMSATSVYLFFYVQSHFNYYTNNYINEE